MIMISVFLFNAFLLLILTLFPQANVIQNLIKLAFILQIGKGCLRPRSLPHQEYPPALRVTALGTKLGGLITHLPNTLGNSMGIIRVLGPDGYHQSVAVTSFFSFNNIYICTKI